MTATLLDRIRLRLPDASADDGFSLLEVMVSFVLFVIVASAASAAVANGIRTSDSTTRRVQATQVAQQDIEKARSIKASLVSAAGYPLTVAVGNRSFTVTRTVSWSTGSSCPTTPTAGVEYYVNVTDVITWAGNSGRSVRMDTVLAC